MTGWRFVNDPNLFGQPGEAPYYPVFVREEVIDGCTYVLVIDAETVALKPVREWADFLEQEWQASLLKEV